MTLHPAIVLIALLVILVLLMAYLGAMVRAAMLQATLDNLWPVIKALGRAINEEVDKTNGEVGPNG